MNDRTRLSISRRRYRLSISVMFGSCMPQSAAARQSVRSRQVSCAWSRAGLPVTGNVERTAGTRRAVSRIRRSLRCGVPPRTAGVFSPMCTCSRVHRSRPCRWSNAPRAKLIGATRATLAVAQREVAISRIQNKASGRGARDFPRVPMARRRRWFALLDEWRRRT
jgi:hypothetical protein